MIECKYKVGDKLFCHKEFLVEKNIYEIGDTIIIHDIDYKEPYQIDAGEELFSVEEINDNFISLAEWREFQIESILNDN